MNQEFKITTIIKDVNLRAVAISPDNSFYAVSDFYELYIYSFDKLDHLYAYKFQDYINSVAFHPTEGVFVVSCGDGWLRKFDLQTGNELTAINLQRPLGIIKFTKNGEHLGIIRERQVLIFEWKIQNLYIHETFTEKVNSIDFDDLGYVLTVGFGNKVQTFWFQEDNSGSYFKVGYENHLTYAVASSNQEPYIAVSAGTRLKIYDYIEKEFIFEYSAGTRVNNIQWFQKDRYLAFSSGDGVTILEAPHFNKVQSTDYYDGYVFAIAKDGSKLITGSRSSDTYIWSK